jgi:hypothetical protein
MGRGWISGGSWDSFDGRGTTLACLGLDAFDRDPDLARQLLDECIPLQQEAAAVVGRRDPRLLRGGLFRPAGDIVAGSESLSRMTNFVS